MSYNNNYYDEQQSYDYRYTTNYGQPSGYEYTNPYGQTGNTYASQPMTHSTSGSSLDSRDSYSSQYYPSSSSSGVYDTPLISPNPLYDIAVSYTDPINSSKKDGHKTRTSSSSFSPKSGGLLLCLHERCEYQTKRQYDLDRHQKTHFPSQPGEKHDCPGRGCGRTGEHGFDRKDHLREHLRKVHAKDIPKQGRSSRSRKSPGQQ
ncbi:hypothetical protein JMJ35_000207 [Cladonia borealis]|uniref:C2H2-type domain-containing protein n=1 Tax=Cladonia borealis TaxID=184061 RepID=A0AA39R8V8_9LECA|nr:hypothetical protein JMJ35_000207 [Cladonia borealis]